MKKIILTLMMLMLTPLALALETTTQPGITPDSPLYGLDVAFDNIKISLATGFEKAKTRIAVIDERLAEAENRALKNDTVNMEKSLKEKDKLEQALKDQTNLTDEQKEFIQNATANRVIVLERVLAKVPEQAKSGIQNAISQSKTNFEDVKTTLPEDKRKDLETTKQQIRR